MDKLNHLGVALSQMLMFRFLAGVSRCLHHTVTNKNSLSRRSKLSALGLAIVVMSPTFEAQRNVLAYPHHSRSIGEETLYRALTKLSTGNPKAFQLLLKRNERFVTRKVWQWLTTEAIFLQRQGFHSACLQRSVAALHLATFLQQPELIGKSYQKLGQYFFEAGNLKPAVENYLASARHFEQVAAKRPIAFVYAEIGLAYLHDGKLTAADVFAKKALIQIDSIASPESSIETVPLEKARAVALTVQAEVALQRGHYDDALLGFALALDVYVTLDSEIPAYGILLTEAYTDVGRAYLEMGRHRSAWSAFLQALSIARDRNLEAAEADVHRFLGLLHLRQENYDRAERALLTSAELFERAGDAGTLRKVLVNLGVLYLRKRDSVKAFDYLKRAERLSKPFSAVETSLLIDQNLGALYQADGKFSMALKYLSQSELAARRAGLDLRVAEALLRKSQVFMSLKEYTRASEAASIALRMATELQANSLMNSSALVIARAAIQNGDSERAYLTLLSATKRVEQMREHITAEPADLAPFFARNLAPFQILADLLVKKQQLYGALEFADRSKGRILLDLFQDGRAKAKDVLTDVEQDDDRRYNRELSDLRQQLKIEQARAKPNRARIAVFHARLEEARLRYASFRDSLIVEHPELRTKSTMPASITPENLKRVIPDDKTAVLEYVVTDEKILSFLVRRSSPGHDPDVHVYSREISREALTTLVSGLREVFAERLPGYVNSARSAYELLIGPAESDLIGINTLCIIPDDILWEVPFQALQRIDGSFLIENVSVHYSPSISVLAEANGRKKPFESSLLAFGNPVPDTDALQQVRQLHTELRFDPIPESETEVTAIGRLYDPDKRAVFVGSEAKESLFKSRARDFGVIHLATHGVLDNLNPLYSYLILARDGPDDDGLLETREVIDLDLNADLVVLSACETARGKIGAGEGVIGMSWAFFAAGCRTTLVTQWKVNSESTSKLMTAFYRELSLGRTKAQALRTAALEMAKQPGYRHPFYWAPFILVGSSQ